MAVVVNVTAIPQYQLANCDAAVAVGDFVYISGDSVGGAYTVALVDYQNSAKMPPRGMVVKKVGDEKCFIQTYGEVKGVFSGLTPQGDCFVGGSGKMTQTAPAIPSSGVRWWQSVGYAMSASVLFLNIREPIVLTPP